MCIRDRNLAVKFEAFKASVVPSEFDQEAVGHRAKHQPKSTYAIEGVAQDVQTVPAGGSDLAMIHKQLSELQAECISTREEIGKVKAQKEETEKF